MRGASTGRADLAALAAALVLGTGALLPGLLLRGGRGWERCAGEALADTPREPVPNPVAGPLATAAGARSLVATSQFRPDPTRFAGPLPDPADPAPAVPVRDLTGRVADGRLYLRWRPVPGSRGTLLRVEGLGGPGDVEREVPADGESVVQSVEIPVPGASGTAQVRAVPAGAPGPAAEARVSIPFRIPVEPVRATAASAATGSALIVLRRAFDGGTLEGEFPLREADPVGGLSPAGPGGPVVDFRTDLVLEKVRAVPGGRIEVPAFRPDGGVARGADGAPVLRARGAAGPPDLEVVLRGPDDHRMVLPVVPSPAPPPGDR